MTRLLYFKQTYPVRYDECNRFGLLTPASVLRYLQDIAGLHVEYAQLNDNGLWIARRTVMELLQPVPARSALEIETYSLGFSRVTGQRGYIGRRLDGSGSILNDPVLTARTLWDYLDVSGKPARIPPNYFSYWQSDSRPGHLQKEADWPPLPDSPPYSAGAVVRFSDLDIMGHMNNAAYIELFDNAGWAILTHNQLEISPRNHPIPYYIDIEYLDSALPGDKLEVSTWQPSGSPGKELSADRVEFERLQHITRQGKLLARALTRWRWLEP